MFTGDAQIRGQKKKNLPRRYNQKCTRVVITIFHMAREKFRVVAKSYALREDKSPNDGGLSVGSVEKNGKRDIIGSPVYWEHRTTDSKNHVGTVVGYHIEEVNGKSVLFLTMDVFADDPRTSELRERMRTSKYEKPVSISYAKQTLSNGENNTRFLEVSFTDKPDRLGANLGDCPRVVTCHSVELIDANTTETLLCPPVSVPNYNKKKDQCSIDLPSRKSEKRMDAPALASETTALTTKVDEPSTLPNNEPKPSGVDVSPSVQCDAMDMDTDTEKEKKAVLSSRVSKDPLKTLQSEFDALRKEIKENEERYKAEKAKKKELRELDARKAQIEGNKKTMLSLMKESFPGTDFTDEEIESYASQLSSADPAVADVITEILKKLPSGSLGGDAMTDNFGMGMREPVTSHSVSEPMAVSGSKRRCGNDVSMTKRFKQPGNDYELYDKAREGAKFLSTI